LYFIAAKCVFFLVKKPRGFSDFCGGMKSGENPLYIACRKGGEELTGFLGDIRELIRAPPPCC
jgi:hypothetical protein